ncbi:hypothetical protein HMPREF1651_06165 [Prevotella bivia DNF00188]|uniref:Uncharacterized protein n=1 Tax=Prevotella bivia DSM 20514 TaxID=868129 RepID=I4ZC42_9BACT|nr:hypothetical protein [Prevotella bivia]EFB93278.1 hypothetical protein HMPREF0648_1356 [Prevotella bivia JCVIHMP010]EFB93882.1 hypothetical protein HMPREF0648_2029 [Prevotella bivia JCVIHMP010]EIM33784.1 hypothetical protein PrebiDRAFT_2120 [Prevotella bivia DSM 20514]KGF22016.1 hypothetical protein HMPREF1651_06165 [Prevotella bivia DNF00188]
MKRICIHITEAHRAKDNRFAQVTVQRIEDATGEGFASAHSKLLQDFICHALSLAHGVEIEGNNGFTYTFPFKLS